MKKQEVYAFLEEKGVWFKVTEHEAVFNMEELGKVELPYPEEELKEKLDLIPGAVTPMGLLQAEAGQVAFFLDEEFLEGKGLIGVHPNDNTATVWLKTEDLIQILKEAGHDVQLIHVA